MHKTSLAIKCQLGEEEVQVNVTKQATHCTSHTEEQHSFITAEKWWNYTGKQRL